MKGKQSSAIVNLFRTFVTALQLILALEVSRLKDLRVGSIGREDA